MKITRNPPPEPPAPTFILELTEGELALIVLALGHTSHFSLVQHAENVTKASTGAYNEITRKAAERALAIPPPSNIYYELGKSLTGG